MKLPTAPLAALCLALALPVAPLAAAPLIPDACPTSAGLARLDAPLPRLAEALASGEKVVIVAIGSSSTAGAGASKPSASYPRRLEAALRQRYPGRDIVVVNRGVNGQDGPEMLARFDRDVVPLRPALVLWQGGVNALFRANGLATAESILREAIQRTRAIDADFLVIDPQYAPRVLSSSDYEPMVALMSKVSKSEGVPVFHRFALMRDWHERGGVPFEAFLSKDRFHMNDWSYDCLGRDLAQALAGNVEGQTRSAGTQHPAVVEQVRDNMPESGAGKLPVAGRKPVAPTATPATPILPAPAPGTAARTATN